MVILCVLFIVVDHRKRIKSSRGMYKRERRRGTGAGLRCYSTHGIDPNNGMFQSLFGATTNQVSNEAEAESEEISTLLLEPVPPKPEAPSPIPTALGDRRCHMMAPSLPLRGS